MPKLRVLLVVVAMLNLPGMASASTIVLFNETRNDSAALTLHRNLEAGPWSDSVSGTITSGSASASQNTDISAGFIGGTGAASTMSNPASTDRVGGDASLFVEFTLFQQYTADLKIDLFAAGGLTHAGLTKDDDPNFHWSAFTRDGLVTLERSGTLLPGNYNFTIESEASSNPALGSLLSSASFNGGLTLAPIIGTEIPEPTTLSLLGIGLLGAAIRKRLQA